MAAKVHVEIHSSSEDASDEDNNISETGISQYTHKHKVKQKHVL